MNDLDRVRCLAYRCYKCGRLITSLEVLAAWKTSEAKGGTEHDPLCPCGSRHISPTNVKWYEELFYFRVWKLWYYRVFKPWWEEKRG